MILITWKSNTNWCIWFIYISLITCNKIFGDTCVSFLVCTRIFQTQQSYRFESHKFEVLWIDGLFRIISISKYCEVDIKYEIPLSINYKYCERIRNVSMRRFNICYYRQLLKQTMNRSYSLNPVCPKFISN